jgi:membrane fusion protein (multidrug efflux system)|tara:strand:- start:3236 stop:4360 length:1125 start_codon:yes stop_codon:yes gene_type:complete
VKFITRHPVFLITIVGALGLAYMVFAKVAEEPAARGGFRGGFGEAPVVGLSSVEQRLIADQIESVGTSVANESVDLAAKVSETVSTINFEDGDFVERGQVLVELVNADEASRLAEAQATVDDAIRQFDRIKNLSSQNLVADNEQDQARTNLDTARARLEGVLVAMDDRLVRAPFSGYLGFRNISEGTLLTSGMVITTLDDVSVIKLDFTIPEIYFAEVKVGQVIQSNSIVYGKKIFEGTVSVVGSRIDPVTRGVSVRATIDNSAMLLRPGMLMTVSLALNEKFALVVPERALIASQGRQYVFVVDSENKVARTEVELGRRRDGFVEVISGLEQGQEVVSEGTVKVRPGQTVQPQGREPNPSVAPKGRPPDPLGT